MSLDDIIKRNQRHVKTNRHGLIGLVADELNDPTADSTDIKNRILAIAIVAGLVIAIAVLAMVL